MLSISIGSKGPVLTERNAYVAPLKHSLPCCCHYMQVEVPEPEEPDAAAAAEHKRKGDVAFVGKSYIQALLAYTQSLKHETSSPVVWANRSATLLNLNQAQKALQDARIARTIDASYTKVGCSKCKAYTASTHIAGLSIVQGHTMHSSLALFAANIPVCVFFTQSCFYAC